MNTRYLLSVLVVAVIMVAGIYAYFQYLAYIDSLKLAERTKVTTTDTALSPRAQEESQELDLLREAAKEIKQVISTTTIKKETVSLDAAREQAQKQVAQSTASTAPIKTAEQEQQELDALREQARAQLTNQ